MTTFLFQNNNKTGIVTGLTAGFNTFSGGSGTAILVNFPDSTVLRTAEGERIECNVKAEVFKAFIDRIKQTTNQIKALDVSQNGLNRMRDAYANPQEWEAFLEEHAPSNLD